MVQVGQRHNQPGIIPEGAVMKEICAVKKEICAVINEIYAVIK